MRKLLPILVLTVCAGSIRADTLYVKPGYYTSIQSAINDANHGDTIIVDPCTYYENIDFLGKAITLTGLDPNDPEIVADTIIDGSQHADPDIGSVVTFSNGEGSNSILTGFTITGGTGSWLQIFWQFKGYLWNRCGGGILCYDSSSPTITKNTITNNLAGQGGGIYFYDHSHPLILENTIIDNNAVIDHGFEDPDPCDPNIYDHGDGGGIVGFQYCDATISDNRIESNYAHFYGGGLHLRQWSNGTIENNQIINNNSTIGPGIHITYSSSPQVITNKIENNHGGSGGALYIYYLSEPNVVANLIRANSSGNGVIGIHYDSGGQIRNNLITENTHSTAIILTSSSPLISHNTIINNEKGGIQCNGDASPKIKNNIIASNQSDYGIDVSESASPTIRYNNIWNNEPDNYNPGTTNLAEIAHNISANPQFIEEPNITMHLDYTSPCIDAGDPNFIADATAFDMDGDARVLNGRTDIGADEARPIWNLTKEKEYLSIQEAIDDSNYGQVIVAISGIYYENINMNGKSVILSSVEATNWDCVDGTVINSNNNDEPIITFAGNEDNNCTLTGFTLTNADNNGSGGAIKGNGTFATISFCNITNNSANQGAGIYDCNGTITNCRISQNSSLTGGGLYGCDGQILSSFINDNNAVLNGGGLYGCDANILNNTIAGNTAGLTGGGLESCQGNISNNIIWGNISPNSPALSNCSVSSYCCIQESISGPENIYVDPQFIDSNNQDYHLNIYSDCIDAGDNDSLNSQSLVDIDNEPRIFTFDPNVTARVDIGADEVVTNQVDFNNDGRVYYEDLMNLINFWLTENVPSNIDLVTDNFINFKDYAAFSAHWLWQAPWRRQFKESALKFNPNSGGYVNIGNPPELNNINTFTYTAWVYLYNSPISWDRIVDKCEKAFAITIGKCLVGFVHTDDGFNAISYSEIGAVSLNEWQFVIMAYDNNGDRNVHIYVNGVETGYQIHNAATGSTTDESTQIFTIGSDSLTPDEMIPDAIIDEVVVYDRVLTQEEIEYLYNSGFGRPTPLGLGSVALWHFDEREGSTVYDSSGNNNHGTLEGAALPVWTDGKFLSY